MDLKQRAKTLKSDIPAVFIALRKKETPVTAKLFAVLTLVYALSPIDFIPDFIPVLGYLDDIIILPALIALTVRFIPKDVLANCREESNELNLKKKWYCALPFVFIWLIIIWIVIKNVFFK